MTHLCALCKTARILSRHVFCIRCTINRISKNKP